MHQPPHAPPPISHQVVRGSSRSVSYYQVSSYVNIVTIHRTGSLGKGGARSICVLCVLSRQTRRPPDATRSRLPAFCAPPSRFLVRGARRPPAARRCPVTTCGTDGPSPIQPPGSGRGAQTDFLRSGRARSAEVRFRFPAFDFLIAYPSSSHCFLHRPFVSGALVQHVDVRCKALSVKALRLDSFAAPAPPGRRGGA